MEGIFTLLFRVFVQMALSLCEGCGAVGARIFRNRLNLVLKAINWAISARVSTGF